MVAFGKLALCLGAVLSLDHAAYGHASSLRANSNTNGQNQVSEAISNGFLAITTMMTKMQDEVDGPEPSKESNDLMDKASQMYYKAYNRVKMARTAIGAAEELLQIGQQSQWADASLNLQQGKQILDEGKKIVDEANKNYNLALQKSPDVDPNCKSWSAVLAMKGRARNMVQAATSDLRKVQRKEPKEFLQMEAKKPFVKVSEKVIPVQDKGEDAALDFLKNYPSI